MCISLLEDQGLLSETGFNPPLKLLVLRVQVVSVEETLIYN